jgi:hypothetical protein
MKYLKSFILSVITIFILVLLWMPVAMLISLDFNVINYFLCIIDKNIFLPRIIIIVLFLFMLPAWYVFIDEEEKFEKEIVEKNKLEQERIRNFINDSVNRK